MNGYYLLIVYMLLVLIYRSISLPIELHMSNLDKPKTSSLQSKVLGGL